MKKNTPLTVFNIISAMKEAGFATKDEMIVAMKEAGFTTKRDISKLEGDISKLEKVLKKEMTKNKRELMGQIATLATTTPTVQQFNKLKAKVESIATS